MMGQSGQAIKKLKTQICKKIELFFRSIIVKMFIINAFIFLK